MMPEVTNEKIEISQQQTRNWILVGVVAFLLVVVQGLYTFSINSTGTEMRETNRNMVEVLTTLKVQQTQINYQASQIEELKDSRKEANATHKSIDTRLNSLEQREALHDQWIQVHTR